MHFLISWLMLKISKHLNSSRAVQTILQATAGNNIGQTRPYLFQIDGRKVAIDYNDSEISQGSGGKILEQLLLRSKPIHQETKTASTSEKCIYHSLTPTDNNNIGQTNPNVALVLRV